MRDILVPTNSIHLNIHDSELAGAAVLFLHFSGANWRMWQRILPAFEISCRPILLDLRGHGKSDTPPSGYHMDEMARDVAGVLDHLAIERAHIVGSSLGAEVGLALAANFPERVISFVNDGALSSESGPYSLWEGTDAEFEEHANNELEKMSARPERFFPSVEALLGYSRAGLEEIGWWNEYVEAMERYGVIEVSPGQFRNSFRKFANLDYFAHYFHYRLEDYFHKVQCPMLLLPGQDLLDEPRQKAVMEALCGLAPKARIADLHGWQHPYGWLVDPNKAVQAILVFLESQLT
jgi:pimeloyl-ACP methyl ester carboxylesterase